MTVTYLFAISLVFGALCLLAWSKTVLRLFFVLGAVLLAGSAWWFVFHLDGRTPIYEFNQNIIVDGASAFFVFLITTLGALSALYAAGYLFKEGEKAIPLGNLRRYGFFFHTFLFTMLLAVLANNLGIMWIAIEATTLASAFLVNVDDKKSSIEAAWKYLILCTVGIALALFGIILSYYSAVNGLPGEEGNLLRWSFLMTHAAQLDPQIMKLAFVFILVGYGTKAGLAPFHSWLPDAHSQAPSPVSALLSGVLLSCAVFGLMRFHLLTQAVTHSHFSSGLLLLFGVISVLVAAPFIFIQRDYKRLFAYSSVEHIGLAAIGFGFGGFLGVYGALLHIMNHAFNKSLLFFTSGHLLHQFQTKEIKKVSGIFKTSPFLGIVFFLAILGIAGLPPFGIFTSEFVIFSAGFAAGKFTICILLFVLLGVIFTGFLKHGMAMTLGSRVVRKSSEKSFLMNALIALGLLIILATGIFIPEPLHALIESAAQVMQGSVS